VREAPLIAAPPGRQAGGKAPERCLDEGRSSASIRKGADMKPIAYALAGLGLLASAARADEKVEMKKDKNDASIEKEHKTGNTTHKTKVKSKARARAGGGKVSKTETTLETKRPGIGNDSKTTTTETKEKDAKGDVVRQEKKVDK
jgi:hypothetical protein